jgi:hypothetical protein
LAARGRAQREALAGGHAWSDALFDAAAATAGTGTASPASAASSASPGDDAARLSCRRAL